MADYIDREQAIEAAYQGLKRPNEDPKWIDICENLKAVPSADVKPVTRSEWVYLGREEVFDISGVRTWGARYQCRSCGFEPIFIEGHGRYDFCPNCGADMRGNDNEREQMEMDRSV